MTALFTLAEIVAATGAEAVGVDADQISSVSIDSRDIAAGALFVAIAGDRFDGHDFVGKAVTAGAVAALVARDRAGDLSGLPLLIVDDPLAGLRALAQAARARSTAGIVAVTGSVGKTSTKEAIGLALRPFGVVHAAVKSFNNHWGVPLTLARMPEASDFGVFEIGMNHAGEITPLVDMVRPHVALVTAVAAAHLEFFDGLEGIAEAKAEIFSGLLPGGTAIINADHDYWPLLVSRAREAGAGAVVTYGYAESADITIRTTPTAEGLHVELARASGKLAFDLPPIGRHTVANLTAALAVAEAFDLPLAPAIEALKAYQPLAGRGQISTVTVAGGTLVLVDESYNANPASMRAALTAFAADPGAGRRILVLGDMLELGPDGDRLHRELAGAVGASDPALVVLVGLRMAALSTVLVGRGMTVIHQPNTEAAIPEVLAALAPGDRVMVKGSLGIGLGRLVDRLKAGPNGSA